MMRNALQPISFKTAFASLAVIIGLSTPAAAQEIQGIYLREKGSLAMLSLRYVPQLMFKNGEVYTDITMPLEDLDIASSKRTEPERWGRWRHSGDKVYFDMPDGEHKVKLYKDAVVPASESLRLEGVWSHQFASVNLDSTVVVEKDVGFSKNGVFATGSFSGASTSNQTDGSSAAGHSSQGLSPRGTYQISGYTIELTQEDGRIDRQLFFLYPGDNGKPDYETINIGVGHYQREAEAFSAELSGQIPSSSNQQLAEKSTNGELLITPGQWTVESYKTNGEFDSSADHCITSSTFDPTDLLDAGWDQCIKLTQDVSAGHGIYNVACVFTQGEQKHNIGIKLNMTIDGDDGQGSFALAVKGGDGYVLGDPHPLKLMRSGGC